MNGFRNLDSNYRVRRDYVPGQTGGGLGAMRQWANVPPGQGSAINQQMTDLQYRMLKAREQNVVARQRLATQIIQGDNNERQQPYRSPIKGGDGFSKYRQSSYEPEYLKSKTLPAPIEQRYSRFNTNDQEEENKNSLTVPGITTDQKSAENGQTLNNNENPMNPQLPPVKPLSLAEENLNRQRNELEELAKLTRPPRCDTLLSLSYTNPTLDTIHSYHSS